MARSKSGPSSLQIEQEAFSFCSNEKKSYIIGALCLGAYLNIILNLTQIGGWSFM